MNEITSKLLRKLDLPKRIIIVVRNGDFYLEIAYFFRTSALHEFLTEKKDRLSDRFDVQGVGTFTYLVRDILTAGVVAILCTFHQK